MKYQELLKASKGLPVKDPIAALWGLNLAGTGWEITGTLPIRFLAKGGYLTGYRIYGTSEGAGVETESGEPAGYKLPMTVESGNLWNGEIEQGALNTQGYIVDSNERVRSCITGLISGHRYTIRSNLLLRIIYAYNGGWDGTRISNIYDSYKQAYEYTFTLPERADSIGVALYKYDSSTTVPSDVTTAILVDKSNCDLFIGDSKLGAEEYVDYQEQKVYKLKEAHKDTVTIDGVVWDILGYDHDEVYDNNGNLAKQSVTIQTHDCFSELQFDAREALFAFPDGLTAGTYHFTVSQQPWYAEDVGKTMQFTLANAIPADGVIVLGNSYNATMIGSTISVYASCLAITATETATISEGSDGTDLGSVRNAISGNTNSIQRALLSNNNYNESAIRQYLNSDGEAGTYWTPQNKWDRPPSWNVSTAGFLRGFNSDFISAIGKVSKRTAKDTVSDGGGYIDTEEKVFLLSRTEAYAGANNSISEGTAYKYYSDYSNLSSASTDADTNRIKYRNGTAIYWWLRSPYTDSAYGVRSVFPSGALNYNPATSSNGIAPACCIILDDINTNPYLQSLFLKPTDPPLPFPAINTYKGENTLSSTETVGEVTVKGRIREVTT